MRGGSAYRSHQRLSYRHAFLPSLCAVVGHCFPCLSLRVVSYLCAREEVGDLPGDEVESGPVEAVLLEHTLGGEGGAEHDVEHDGGRLVGGLGEGVLAGHRHTLAAGEKKGGEGEGLGAGREGRQELGLQSFEWRLSLCLESV